MKLDKLLKRHFWAVIVAFVAVAAFFHAQAITHIIAFRLAPDAKELAAMHMGPGHPPTSGGAGSARDLSAMAILERNPFDSVTGPLIGTIVDLPGQAPRPPIDTSDPRNAPECEGVKVIVIAASPDPDWSFASFTPTAPGVEQKSVLRRRGGDVSGKTVHFIGWDRVWLETGPSLCQIAMFQPPPPPGTPSATPKGPEKAGGSGADALTKEISKGIQKVSATQYKIERSVVDKILENTAVLMSSVRVVPESGDKGTGIRLFGVKPESLLGLLGMENGDRLQTINGFDMTNPEKALEAYARLRTADHLTVAVDRKGAATNLDYDVQ